MVNFFSKILPLGRARRAKKEEAVRRNTISSVKTPPATTDTHTPVQTRPVATDFAFYKFKPLEDTTKIRVLTLTGTTQDGIECMLEDIDVSQGGYQALSCKCEASYTMLLEP
jgi:hypothetical protein